MMNSSSFSRRLCLALAVIAGFVLLLPAAGFAQNIRGELLPDCNELESADPPFDDYYDYMDLATMPELTEDSTNMTCLQRESSKIMRRFQGELEGKSIFRIKVDTTGRVIAACHLRLVHPDVLNPLAPCIMGLRFKPATMDGQKVTAWAILPLDFKLK
ncbi:MAG: hypothetical protein AAGN35_15805 [Bacteroidota bacterium]